MTMKRWDGSTQIDLTLLKRWDGASWIDITLAKRWDGSAWIDIALPGGGGLPGSPVTVTASPGSATMAVSDFDPLCPTHTSTTVTATAAGGTAPYTYVWTKVSGNSAVVLATPQGAAATWEASVCHGTKIATWRCTATDSLGATGTVDVTVTL